MIQQEARLYKPQIHLARPTTARMWLVSLCAVLTIFQSSLSDSFGSLIVAFTAVVTAIFTESLIYFRTERAGTIKDGSAITSALVLTLFLPNQLHPVYAALGAAFAMTVVKHSFGGVGANWMNPAVGGWLFIRFSWPEVFNNALDQSIPSLLSEGMSRGLSDPEGSPLGILTLMKTEYYPTQETFLDAALGFVLNDGLFARIQMEFPRSYISLFTTTAPGIIADRGIFALLAGTIIITASQASRGWIPAVYLGGYMVMVRLFGALPFGGSFGQGDLFFGLCSGGVLAAAFLSASDPATGPKSNGGAAAAGIAGGLITFFFRYYGLEAYGAFFAAALINTIVPILRDFESRNWYTYRKDRTNGKNEQTSEVP